MSNKHITYKSDIGSVDWSELKATLVRDSFDNGRSPEQLRDSFENSYATCFAYTSDRIIGTARALSDGICNAYIVDVWTLSEFRRQGVARTMVMNLLAKLQGQHVYLFTDHAQEFYEKLGFKVQGIGMGVVVGEWLRGNKS